MSLLTLQRGFRDHILAGAAAPLPSVAPEAEPGLAIYRHAYRANLAACLRDTYEKTLAWLGYEAFDAAAIRYIEAHPPSSWTLSDYGADFTQFLGDFYLEDPEVAELAWLDWALRRAFDGADAQSIAAEALAEVDWEDAVFVLVPTLVLGKVVSNCAAIWGALAQGETPPSAVALPGPAAIRVWRSSLSPRYRTIEDFEHAALALALEGSSFAEICAALAEGEEDEEAAARLGALLCAWLLDGLIWRIDARAA